MREDTDNALEELKRADHLIYVSLKYTRTTDVIRSTIKRLISAYNYAILDLLEYSKNKNLIKKIPIPNEEKVNLAKQILKNQSIKYIKLYDLLKLIDKSEYSSKEEFRKNVTLTTKTKKPIEIKTDTLHDYFDTTKEFITLVEDFIKK